MAERNHGLYLLDEVLLNFLSDANHMSDPSRLQFAEVLLPGCSVGAEEEARHDLLHVPPHGVGPVVHRPHHEAVSVNVNILSSLLVSSSIHLGLEMLDVTQRLGLDMPSQERFLL